MPTPRLPNSSVARSGAVALAYVVLAELTVAIQVGDAAPLAWLPAGFAVGVLVLGGLRLWPGVLAGAGLAAFLGGIVLPVAAVVTTATTVQVVVGAHLCRRLWLHSRLDRIRDVVVLAGAGGMVASMLGAVLASGALWALSGGRSPDLVLGCLQWWMAAFLGVILMAPATLLAPTLRWRPTPSAASPATLVAIAALPASAALAFSDMGRPYMLFPALLVVALRFRVSGAVLASLVVHAATVWATGNGPGRLTLGAGELGPLYAQAFIGTVTLTALMLGALMAERLDAQERLLDSEAERLVMAVEGEAEQRFRRSFEDAPIGMALLGFNGHLLRVNHMLSEITGFAAHELVGRTLQDLTHPGDSEADLPEIGALLAGTIRSFETEKRLVRRDGHVAWVVISGSLVRDDAGRPAYLIAHLMDITERRRVEAELAISTDELRRSNQELERFAYIASHDLGEPLRTMSGFATLLRERYADVLDDRGLRYADHVVGGAKRMHELIDGLLEYSRAGRQDLRIEPVDCLALAREVVGELRASVRDKDATVTIDELPTVMGDPVLLRQVFQNLVSNALKFTGERRPEIVIDAEWDSAVCRFSVSDNGIGIDERHAERIFEMFQRLHTREQYDGTGIGLALVKRIVELHGGRISMQSTAGAGTTFTFTLAVAPAEVTAERLALPV